MYSVTFNYFCKYMCDLLTKNYKCLVQVRVQINQRDVDNYHAEIVKAS